MNLGFFKHPDWNRLLAPWFVPGIIALLGILCLSLLFVWHRNPSRTLPFYEPSDGASADHWRAFGGAWDISGGSMRNDSTERGAKLIAGSPNWTDYSMAADIELLGPGDAGIIVRVSEAETGVDSYTGYYIGLRTLNSTFIIGRAHHGWREYPAVKMESGIRPFEWYHLRATVVGCEVEAEITSHSTGESKKLRLTADECYPSGQVGLRSYSSGGVWRNIVVTSAKGNQSGPAMVKAEKLPVFDQMMLARNVRGSYLRSMNSEDKTTASGHKMSVQPISSLRLLIDHPAPLVSIRGVVILSTPGLYVQDSTGGVLVTQPHGPVLKVGDEVEVQGSLASSGLYSTLKNASVQLLWEGEPPPPYSITLNQAAGGNYDSTFVEVGGLLKGKNKGKGDTIVLDMEGPSQTFQAILNPGRSTALFRKLRIGSTLRLRGICVVDPLYTHSLNPFALLVRSVEDVQVVTGPPWWSWYFLARVLLVLTVFALFAYVLYLRVRNWRMAAVLRERGRLAHEIHDTLAQSFAGIGFQLQAVLNRLPNGDSILREQVELACSLVRYSHEETRRSISTLHHESHIQVPLAENLHACARRMVGREALPVSVVTLGQPRELPLQIENELLRIGQEATANAVSHSRASTVTITISYRKASVCLRIEDNGSGFKEGQTSGFGVAGIRRRAAGIDAQVLIESSPTTGTTIEVTAPLPSRTPWAKWLSPPWDKASLTSKLRRRSA